MINKKIIITGGSGFIGTNLIEDLKTKNVELLNLDMSQPLYAKHNSFWKKMDIMDCQRLVKTFREFGPDCVVHLAARTDCKENTTVEKDYRVNTEGTKNVIVAIKSTPDVYRAILTSTQYVYRPGPPPKHPDDYDPHTVYGKSKVITEKIIKNANLDCTWTIIRPTNVWGPWHLRHREQIYKILRKGLYFRAGRISPVISYAYVRNVSYQIQRLLELPSELVNKRTIYVGDRPIKQDVWLNSFSRKFIGREVYCMPVWFMRFAGWAGDVITLLIGKPFVLTTARVRNMINDYPTPMEQTFELLGENPYSIEAGVEQTIAWLNAYDRGEFG